MIRIFMLTVTALVGLSTVTFADIQRFSKNPTLQSQANLVQMSIDLEAPISTVWKLVGENFDKSKLFNVEAASTAYIQGNAAKVGTRRRTVDANDKFIDVEIFRHSRANHVVAWEIIATDLAPISFGYSEYRLEEIGAQKTRLTQVSGFKMGNGLVDTAMRFRFPTILKTELSAIKHYVETGQTVTPKTARQLRKKTEKEISVRKNW